MSLSIPRVKPLGWGLFEILTSSQQTQIDLNISLLDQQQSAADRARWHDSLHRLVHRDNQSYGNTYSTRRILGIRRSNSSAIPRLGIVLLQKTSDSKIYWARASDGMFYDAVPTLINAAFTSSDSADRAVPGGPGVVFMDGYYTANYGAAWAAINAGFFAGGNPVRGVGYAFLTNLGATRYFVSYEGATILRYSTTPGGAPVDGAFPEALESGGTFYGATTHEYANDGLSNVLLCAKKAGNTFNSIYRTSNGGDAWTKVLDLAGTEANVIWHAARSVFVAWDNLGHMWTSPTGATGTWTATGSGAATEANGFVPGPKMMHSCGEAIVRSYREPTGNSAGYAYTFDMGATWNTAFFGSSGVVLSQLTTFDGRLFAQMNGTTFVSGLLAAPAPVFT